MIVPLKYPEIIQTLSLILSLATFIFAIRISKKIGKNHIRTKQIDHVCELIRELNEVKIQATFSTYDKGGAYSGTGHGLWFNIFEIGSYDEIEPQGLNKDYENEVVLFDTKSNQIMQLKGYINHPLTPKPIADELLLFYNRGGTFLEAGRDDNYLNKFVVLHTGIWEDRVVFKTSNKGFLIQGNANVFTTWLNLKNHSKSLKIIIGNWLIENGITENNMREDFKNV